MSSTVIRPGSLVLYKVRPALVRAIAEKIEIELEGGKSKRVRDKDIALLHPGPVRTLDALKLPTPEIEETWELLSGEQTTLSELAELLYGEYSPASAWSAWELIADGMYFSGKPEHVVSRSAADVDQERADRAAKETAAAQWESFLTHVTQGDLDDDDRRRLGEVERVALGESNASRILAHFGVPEQMVSAHKFLIKCGYWPAEHNPHPRRVGVGVDTPKLPVPELADEPRRDFTGQAAYAIDDVGNQDPDDAISLDGDRLWVHVADVAALVPPDSELDLAARARAANLYLPEGISGMLPAAVTEQLGLGLQEESPALSIGFRLAEDGVTDIEAVPSRVRVTRTTYDIVERQLDRAPFAGIREMTESFRRQRLARGATELDLPETSVKLIEGDIVIRPLERLASRQMVTDAMLMAGEAVARLAAQAGVAIPHATQAEPSEIRQPASMAEMYSYRRLFKPSQASLLAGAHFGLGLTHYTRATSPLRRYLDLVAHQQLRAMITGCGILDEATMAERIGASEAVTGLVRRAERLSNLHWKLAWLQRQGDWRGTGTVVELGERKAAVLIPELALETRIRLQDKMRLDQAVRLRVREVDLSEQLAYFQVLE